VHRSLSTFRSSFMDTLDTTSERMAAVRVVPSFGSRMSSILIRARTGRGVQDQEVQNDGCAISELDRTPSPRIFYFGEFQVIWMDSDFDRSSL
jgi:hypothetical protein